MFNQKMALTGSRRKADMKVVLLGEASIGKTTLLYRYIDGIFQETVSTIGASFSLKQWGPYNVAIWDTAGEERFSGLSSFYCRGASAAILAYDITSRQSFSALRDRFLPLLDSAEENCLKIVVGTKLDLVTPTNRQVTTETAEQFALAVNAVLPPHLKNVVPHFQTSSKTGEGVQKLFEYIFNALLPLDGSQHKRTIPIGLNLTADDAKTNERCCSK